jgi:hypothetical protein
MTRRVVVKKLVVILVDTMKNMEYINAILHLEDHMIVVPVFLAGDTIFNLCHKGIFLSCCLFALPLTAVAAISSKYFFPFLLSFTLARLSGLMSIPKPYSLETNADIITPAHLSLLGNKSPSSVWSSPRSLCCESVLF